MAQEGLEAITEVRDELLGFKREWEVQYPYWVADYIVPMTDKLTVALKVVKQLQKPCNCEDGVYVCQDCGYIWHI